MRHCFFVSFFLLFSIFLSFSQSGKIQFNGTMDTSFQFERAKNYEDDRIPYSMLGKFKYGWQNQANLRLKAQISEFFSFGFSFNVTTLAGTYTDVYRVYYSALSSSVAPEYDYDPNTGGVYPTGNLVNKSFYSIPFYYKATYIGAFEIERLYFKVGNQFFDIESGILRLNYGYGVVFSPNDFFNPPNPLNLQGRPEGVLSFVSNFYPADMVKLQLLSVAPEDPIESEGWDFKFGATSTFSVNKLNFQFIYMLFLPQIEYQKDPVSMGLPSAVNNDFTHLFGFSMKADVVVGLTFEAQYRLEQRSIKTGEYYGNSFYGYQGLQAAIGIDYTIIGRVYLLLEYMFYGSGMVGWKQNIDVMYVDRPQYDLYSGSWYKVDPVERQKMFNPDKKPLYYFRHNYINGMIRVKAHDILHLGGSFLFGADDISAYLSLFVEIAPMQALSINITMASPVDRTTFGIAGEPGEFSSANLGYHQQWTVDVKVKF